MDTLLDLGCDSLERKRTVVQKLMDERLFPCTRRYLGSLRNHYSALGVNGINELVRNFTADCEDSSTPAGREFAPGLLDHIRACPSAARWTWSAVLAWLQNRRGLLDGVVFSGGEPTLQPGLEVAAGQVRELGFRVGLHTAGSAPAALREVLPLLDWVGFDFKAPFADYSRVTAGADRGRTAQAAATFGHSARAESKDASIAAMVASVSSPMFEMRKVLPFSLP